MAFSGATTPTSIRRRSTTTKAKAKEHLRIDADDDTHDAQVSRLLAAAKEAADQYCQSDFGGGLVPAGVEQWILMQVANLFEWPVNGEVAVNQPGVGTAQLAARMDTTLLRTHKGWFGF